MAVGAIAGAVVGNEIGNTAQSDRGFEAIGVTHDPVGHKAAITAAGHAHSIVIDPGVLLQRDVQAIHDVLVIFAAPFAHDTAFEPLPITGLAARIREQDGITFGGVNLELLVPIDAV